MMILVQRRMSHQFVFFDEKKHGIELIIHLFLINNPFKQLQLKFSDMVGFHKLI